tara:strand:- start:470 stop:796 length:327 start_codon:yes stop_codon:yes gene_type:complete
MTYIKTLLAVAMISVIAAYPAQASDSRSEGGQSQMADSIAENTAQNVTRDTLAGSRNVTAIRKTPAAAQGAANDGNTPVAGDPGAQALMALGVALIVTPAMFRGAFSN